MDPIEYEGWTGASAVYAADQPEYLPLHVARLNDAERSIVTVWKFTWRERLKILAGAPLFLSIMTFGRELQPILPEVGESEYLKQQREGQ